MQFVEKSQPGAMTVSRVTNLMLIVLQCFVVVWLTFDPGLLLSDSELERDQTNNVPTADLRHLA